MAGDDALQFRHVPLDDADKSKLVPAAFQIVAGAGDFEIDVSVEVVC